MPIDDLKAFFAKLETDTALQEQARALQGSADDERVAGLCRLAADAGFAVTPEDWKSAAAGTAAAELDDQALRAVVGGLCDVIGSALGPRPEREFQG
ncbi:MAG: Nif11-like leader peptide family RiPP precursor [Actinomycetes bacterium]